MLVHIQVGVTHLFGFMPKNASSKSQKGYRTNDKGMDMQHLSSLENPCALHLPFRL